MHMSFMDIIGKNTKKGTHLKREFSLAECGTRPNPSPNMPNQQPSLAVHGLYLGHVCSLVTFGPRLLW